MVREREKEREARVIPGGVIHRFQPVKYGNMDGKTVLRVPLTASLFLTDIKQDIRQWHAAYYTCSLCATLFSRVAS